MKLMIVDDHAGVRQMIRQMVAASGDIVQECSSGDEAVQVAAEFRPDLVTMDVRMPGLSGLEATRAILAVRSDVRVLMAVDVLEQEVEQATFGLKHPERAHRRRVR